MNPLDTFMQKAVPTVIVPRHEPLKFLETIGHRILMASNGVYLEVRRNWLHLIHQIAPIGITLPYGDVQETMGLPFNFPLDLVRQFYKDALDRFPNECGGWIIHNTETGKFRYELLTSLKASEDYLEVVRPTLVDGENLVIDLHSHGYHIAEFSPLDDADDAHETVISGVIGSLGENQEPTASFRLCACGVQIPFRVNVAKILSPLCYN